MLTILKAFNLVMSVAEMVMGMFKDESLRQEGRNQVSVKAADRMKKARDKADAKVKSFDDAIAVALSRVSDTRGDNR